MARHWRFSSKRLGLNILQSSVKGTGGRVLPFQELPRGSKKVPRLNRKGHTILVRSDQPNQRQLVNHYERTSQPRQHFKNNAAGRAEARSVIRGLVRKYGIIVHHLSKPRKDVKFHGRIFIAPNGRVWLYLAPPTSHTTFARWDHAMIAKYDLSNPKKPRFKSTGLSPKAVSACQKVAANIFHRVRRMGLTDISRTAFVVYKDMPNRPEFYDLLRSLINLDFSEFFPS
jgi:hypothetical protein